MPMDKKLIHNTFFVSVSKHWKTTDAAWEKVAAKKTQIKVEAKTCEQNWKNYQQ